MRPPEGVEIKVGYRVEWWSELGQGAFRHEGEISVDALQDELERLFDPSCKSAQLVDSRIVRYEHATISEPDDTGDGWSSLTHYDREVVVRERGAP
jgi:hypothetical protein